MMTEKCKEERVDNIGFGNLRLVQRPEDFCYGIDAVLLANFTACNTKGYENVVELGAGNGAVSIIMNKKKKAKRIVAIEIQENAAELAQRNAKLNGMEDVIQVKNCDILNIEEDMYGSFDAVVTNPPYMTGGCGLTNNNKEKTIARHEITADLETFFKIASKVLKDKGELFMVHRPWRLPDLMTLSRKQGLEPKIMQLVAPKDNEPANIVLIKYVKNGGVELKLFPEIKVRDKEGNYTKEINSIYEK